MTVSALLASVAVSAGAAVPDAAVSAGALVDSAEPPGSGLGWRLLIMGLALLTSFLFSAVEFAVIRLDRLKLETDAEATPPDPAAKLLSGFLRDSGRFLACISIGNTLANLLLSSFVAVTFSAPLAAWAVKAIPGRFDPKAVEAVTTALVTLLLT